MFERQRRLPALPVEQSEVEMGLGVVRPQLDRAKEVVLRFVQLPLFEKDQPEVRVEDEDVRVLARQAAVDDFRFRKRVGLEVDQPQQIENVGVLGAQPLSILELTPSLRVASFLKRFTSSVVVEQEDTLVEWRCNRRITLRPAVGLVLR